MDAPGPGDLSTVDIQKATYTNSVGLTELKTVWTDPDFDASLHAFYYVRVLEISTPRWTLIQAVKSGLPRLTRCRSPARNAHGPRRSGTRHLQRLARMPRQARRLTTLRKGCRHSKRIGA